MVGELRVELRSKSPKLFVVPLHYTPTWHGMNELHALFQLWKLVGSTANPI